MMYYFARMRPYTKSREPASAALILLREKLQMSQAEFAIKVLEVAPMTVSRMETNNPPSGAMLLKLEKIARSESEKKQYPSSKNDLELLARRFRGLHSQELVSAAPRELVTVPPTFEDQEPHGHLTMTIQGDEGLRLASRFLTLIPALKSKDEKTRKRAIAIAEKFVSAVDELDGNPSVQGLRDALHPPGPRNKSRKG